MRHTMQTEIFIKGARAVSYTHLDVYKRQALPSQQDLLVTRQIQEALSPLNSRLADHVVVADSDYVSMAESGLLAR